MRLLLFNLATDGDDPILGFTTRWIRALAARVDFIHVVTMRMGKLDLPDNVRVYSVGKERGYSEPRRVIEFYRILARIVREEHVDVCFSHMNPLFTVLAGPFLKLYKIPTITWYAHPKVTWILRIAHCFSDRMVASVSTAYPYRRDKFIAIGQGIDTKLFSPDARVFPQEPPMILCVGRLSPVKDHPTLIKAIWLLRQAWPQTFRVVVLGGPATARDDSYVVALYQQVKQLGLEETFNFEPAVTMEKLPSWYRRCAVVVNMTPTGSGDKVVWEAMACGKLCLVANEGFRETLGTYADGFLYTYGDSEQLAERLKWVLSLPQTERSQIAAYLTQQVKSMHGLSRLAQNLVSIFNSVKHSQNTTGTAQAAKSS
jgi:glycosyltransferase involved in cell wall biosynthesis